MIVQKRLTTKSSGFLDLVRTTAAQLVVIGHSISWLGLLPGLQQPQAPYLQNIAVVTFFLLSGFFISYVVRVRWSAGYSFGSYFIDRFSRVYSVFVPCLVAVALIDGIHIALLPESYSFGAAYNVKTAVGNLLMLHDYPVCQLAGPVARKLLGFCREGINLTSFGSGRPFWVLAILWWLYMFYGWVSLFPRKSGKRHVVWYCVVLGFLAIVPLYNLYGRGGGLTIVWFLGVGVDRVWASGALRSYTKRLLLQGSVLSLGLALCYCYLVTRNAYDLRFFVLMSVALLLAVSGLSRIAGGAVAPSRRILSYMARSSFALYLLHYSVISILRPVTGSWNPWMALCLFVVVSNGLAVAMTAGTETLQKWLRERMKVYIRRWTHYGV